MGALTTATLVAGASLALAACSPEAVRARDGGPGADPGNKDLVTSAHPDPRAADSTLGMAAPVELLAKGPPLPASYPPPAADSAAPQQRTFDKGSRANPERPEDGP